jgi:hypothetical protein
MADLYSTLMVRLLEVLFQREGLPDGLWVWDDLGYKQTPFMSTAMYRELIFPAHKKLFDFAHSHNLPVVLHCDGFVEALIPSLIEAGINCLQPIEIKAGMDLLRIKKNYGDKIALIGGMDERVLETNDLAAVRRELETKVPAAMAGSGYVLQGADVHLFLAEIEMARGDRARALGHAQAARRLAARRRKVIHRLSTGHTQTCPQDGPGDSYCVQRNRLVFADGRG